jgi:predicted GIY-YIG superfamily endonuclease
MSGVTANLPRRAFEHREGLVKGFSAKYGCKILVWYEAHDTMIDAITREKQIKAGSRAKKLGPRRSPKSAVERSFRDAHLAVIASGAKQSRVAEKSRRFLDCFVVGAPRNDERGQTAQVSCNRLLQSPHIPCNAATSLVALSSSTLTSSLRLAGGNSAMPSWRGITWTWR